MGRGKDRSPKRRKIERRMEGKGGGEIRGVERNIVKVWREEQRRERCA